MTRLGRKITHVVVTSTWALSVLVFATGLVGGIVGYLTGVASLVTYPALLALGFPPITANVTNAINNFGSSLGSVLTGWRSMRAVQAYPLWPQMFISAVGGAIGAVLLLAFDPKVFEFVVPWLVLIATLSTLIGPYLERRGIHANIPVPTFLVLVGVLGVYGGYFGAASAVVYLGIAAILTPMTTHEALLLKSPVLGCANLTALLFFIWSGEVDYAAALTMMLGGLLGGMVGPHLQRFLPGGVVRWLVGIFGTALAIWLLLRALG